MQVGREFEAERSPALAPPPGNLRFPMMDVARGIACLTVLIVHTYGGKISGVSGNLIDQLQIAVQVFFAISGFLLFRPYVLALARGERRPRTFEFLRRRGLRILPAYWVALTLTAAIFGARWVQGAFRGDWGHFYGFRQVYWNRDQFHGIGAAWTLCVEVTFYLLLPLLGVVMWRLARARDWQWAALAIVAFLFVLGPLVRFLNTYQLGWVSQVIQHSTYTLPGQANYFGAGMLLAVLSVALELGRALPRPVLRFAHAPTDAWSLALFLFVLAAIVGGFASPLAPPGVGLLSFRARFVLNDVIAWGLVFMLLMPAVFGTRPGGVPDRVLRWRPLATFGVISYGVYLWHVPIGSWLIHESALRHTTQWPIVLGWPVRIIVLLALASVAGALSYRFVELPFLRLKNARRRREPRDAGLSARRRARTAT